MANEVDPFHKCKALAKGVFGNYIATAGFEDTVSVPGENLLALSVPVLFLAVYT
jgi:hypothetical protein